MSDGREWKETPKERTGASYETAPASGEPAFSVVRSEAGSLWTGVDIRPNGLSQRLTVAEERLAWPPRAEDLKRLYADEHLSAARIAKVYGLQYASPKTAESTVLYHLKRAGIARRDAAEHVRKATPEMVDEWVRRYEAGESLKQIAGGKLSPVTVWNHMRKRGVTLRGKIIAQIQKVTKHEKLPFQGSALDEAYLLGFARGDLFVTRHGRCIRVRTATTHPTMTELFRSLFALHGPVYEYPRKSELTDHEWSLDCDLDNSFEFLLGAHKKMEWAAAERAGFMAFLAGFFDAEGSLYFHRKKRWGAFELSIANMDEDLLRRIAASLTGYGYSATVKHERQNPDRGVKNGREFIWRLALWRYSDVTKLLKEMPLRHQEKTRKAEIAFRLGLRATRSNRDAVVAEWESLAKEIRTGRDAYVGKAQKLLDLKK